MDDFSQTFRRFLHLDRKRQADALTPRELRLWMHFKRLLSEEFNPGSLESADQRESVRVPARVAASFGDVGELRDGLMTNMSRGGVFVATDQPLAIGSRFELCIRMDDTGEEFDVPVEVVSNNARPDRAVFRPGMGVRFCDVAPEVRARLDALYERTLLEVGEERASTCAERDTAAAG